MKKLFQSNDKYFHDSKQYLFGTLIEIRQDVIAFQLYVNRGYPWRDTDFKTTWGYDPKECKLIYEGE